MSITLKPELEELIVEDVKLGRSSDPDEFLDKAIYHYILARDLGEDYSRDEIEDEIALGLADAERGEVIGGEEAFRRLRAYSAERRLKRA
jgi:predicted transcriptional regulator